MKRKIFVFFLLTWRLFLLSKEDTPYYQASICGDPNSYVDGCVSVISGCLIHEHPRIIIQGKEPIELTKKYVSFLDGEGYESSLSKRDLFGGWSNWDYLLAKAFYTLPVSQMIDGESCVVRKERYWVKVTDPTGIVLSFYGPKYTGKPITLELNEDSFETGITNTSSGQIGAKLNLLNTKAIKLDAYTLKIIPPDGGERFYKSVYKDGYKTKGVYIGYVLQSDKKPNGTQTLYSYVEHDIIKEIKTTNHDGTKVYAWAKFNYFEPEKYFNMNKIKNADFTITTSDHQTISFTHERVRKKKDGIYLDQYFLLKDISSERFSIQYDYRTDVNNAPPLLNCITTSGGKTSYCDYYYYGKKNREHGEDKVKRETCKGNKVIALKKPIGKDQKIEITHRFYYDLAKNKNDPNNTVVEDIYGNRTDYLLNKDLRLEKIKRYSSNNKQLNSEEFLWGKAHDLHPSFLIAKTFYGKNEKPIFSKTYSYDKKGNLLKEKTVGNISGNCAPLVLQDSFPVYNGVDRQQISTSFIRDKRNLLENIYDPNDLAIHYKYLPDTNLISSEFSLYAGMILRRKFYEYDADYTLIKIVEDDGSRGDVTNLSNVTQRKITHIIPRRSTPFIGMPDHIIYKYHCFDMHQEKLEKLIKFEYDKRGNIAAKHFFDADNKQRYTLYYTYNERNDLIKETNPFGEEAFYIYNLDHNKIYEKDFSGKETKYTFDHCNRLVQEETYKDSSSHYITKYEYNKNNYLTKQIDHQGNTTEFVVDLYGNIIQKKEPVVLIKNQSHTSPITHISYDECDNPIKMVSPLGNCTTTIYNIFKQPIKKIYPDHSFETWNYNLDQTLKFHTNKENITVAYAYDRLRRKEFVITSCKNGDIVKKETYKYRGPHLSEKRDSMDHLTEYFYNGLGQKIKEVFSHNQKEIILYSYDAMGFIEKETHEGENPLIIQYKRDLLGRTIEISKKDDKHLFSLEKYSYDSAGNKNSITRFINGKEAIETYSYDLFNRLIKQTDPLGNVTCITYDDFYIDEQGRKGIKKTEVNPLKQVTITIYDHNQNILSKEKLSSL